MKKEWEFTFMHNGELIQEKVKAESHDDAVALFEEKYGPKIFISDLVEPVGE